MNIAEIESVIEKFQEITDQDLEAYFPSYQDYSNYIEYLSVSKYNEKEIFKNLADFCFKDDVFFQLNKKGNYEISQVGMAHQVTLPNDETEVKNPY